MPSGPMQKSTGKKASGAMRAKDHPRSRNTTPNPTAGVSSSSSSAPAPLLPTARLPPIDGVDTDYLEIRVEQFRNLTQGDLVDQPNLPSTVIPDSRSLDAMIARLQRLQETIERRNKFCDRSMRKLVEMRKNRVAEKAPLPKIEVAEADEKDKSERKTEKKSKQHKKRKVDALGPNDANIDRSSPLRDSNRPRKLSRDNDSASSSLSPVEPSTPTAMEVDGKTKTEEKSDSESDDDAPPPRKEMPQAQTFGEDPSTFPDPTIYQIREIKPGMTEDQIREIYSIATYPPSDLADLIAGDPPDKDFSSAKPTNQIAFTTFSAYIEPYFRPFGEEDLAFLRERGDRTTPFVFPKRGKKHYTELWAEEDSVMQVDSPQGRDRLPSNQPRGSIDNMDDDVAETDKLSVGPLLSRLMQTMRPESRAPAPNQDDRSAANGFNGDIIINSTSVDSNGDPTDAPLVSADNVPPACFMLESSTEAWKKATHPKLDYNQVDERIKQELRHIGFLPQEGFDADYDGHFDDEVSARLRLLQARLREQILVNGSRKARLAELVRERMAHQEYQTILEDLDSQVQGAYLKRTRTMGKSKKAKRPGGVSSGANAVMAAAGVARQGIGDLTKTLMGRRRRWIDTIGSVFDDPNLNKVPRNEDPGSSVFSEDAVGEYIKKEKEQWEEEIEDDDDDG